MDGKLERDFFRRSALEVAKDIMGKELVRVSEEGKASGTIIGPLPIPMAAGGRRAMSRCGERPATLTSI